MLRYKALILMLLLGFAAVDAQAFDVLPRGDVDASTVGGVASAETHDDARQMGLKLQTFDRVLSEDESLRNQDQAYIIEKAHRASLLFGYGLSRTTELHLGIHGTYEHVTPAKRDLITIGDAQGDGGERSWQGLKQTAFSGGSMLLKFNLVDRSTFKWAWGPFVESGAGAPAKQAMTRAFRPVAGWMTMLSLISQGVGEIGLNSGYRYRHAERFANDIYRNEVFYSAILKAYLGRQFAIYTSGEGRHWDVADALADQRVYKAIDANALRFGFLSHFGDLSLALEYGVMKNGKHKIGYAQRMGGLSLTYQLGAESRRTEAAASRFDDAEYDEDLKEIESEASSQPSENASGKKTTEAKAKAQQEETEVIAIDPFAELEKTPKSGKGERDDFEVLSNKLKEQHAVEKAKQPQMTEDERLEKELSELRAAEQKLAAEKARQLKEEEALQRKTRGKQLEDGQKRKQQLRDDLRDDVESLPVITRDEYEWNGLD